MKHYQSKFQSPLLRFVGFLAGLAAQTQVFSGADAASVLEASEGKKISFCSGSPNISGNLTLLWQHTRTLRGANKSL